MIKLILVLVLTAAACNAAPEGISRIETRIVGGTIVDIKNYPYQLSLEVYGLHNCGAVIVSKDFALTAAHCTDEINVSALTVRAGTSVIGSGGQVVQVRRVHQYPYYDSEKHDYDLAILELAEPIKLTAQAKAVALPKAGEEPTPGDIATVTGWGRTRETGSPSRSLQAVNINVISREDCKKDYGFIVDINDRMCCAGSELGGKDACNGDYGGPLVAAGKLVGISSFGYGCARPRYPGVYTHLGNYNVRKFINNIVKL